MMKLSALVLAAVTGFSAQAATNIASLFSDVTVNRSACFVREYDQAHLNRNKRQTVERIKIKLKKTKYENEQYPGLAIQVKRKGENRVWTNNISCFDTEKNTVLCAVECDGGSVEVLSRDASGKLVLKNNGVLLYGGCGADDENQETIFLERRRGGDDVFHLQQADARACADVSDEAY